MFALPDARKTSCNNWADKLNMSRTMPDMDFDFELLNAKAADQLRATALLVERAGKPSRRSWTIPFSGLCQSKMARAQGTR